ncbi:MAG: hypothetical protein HDT39_00840 [Lachnospiraceae bacterium]|nr:hypothetical protein [Lachnospiraceae bacterium]
MTEFYNLPDNIKSDMLKEKFIEFLVCYSNNTTKENINYVLDELSELSDRQWNTYENLDNEVKCQIEKFLISVIDFENESIMDSILCIIPRLGLENLFLYVLSKKDVIVNKKVVQNIIESKTEYGETVSNPYADM